MNDEADVTSEWLLTEPAVRAAIDVLTAQPLHQAFVLYLQLRRAAKLADRFDGLNWSRELIHEWLDVPGGPPSKPYFRPFAPNAKGDTFWLNSNLSGSYAPSSLRPEIAALFLEDKKYRLPVDANGAPDPNPIATALLANAQVPAWAVAAYLFRNYSFWVGPEEAKPGVDELLDVFQDYFGWTSPSATTHGERELFDWDARPSALADTMEPAASTLRLDAYPLGVQAVVLDDEPARKLDAAALGVGYEDKPDRASTAPDAPLINEHDEALKELIRVIEHYGGVILSGPPGTSKSYRAAEAAKVMTAFDEARYKFIQFHQSYQFDDFIEGYRPREEGEGGFERRSGVFVEFCERAATNPDLPYVLVIDELSRGDVGRIFGEALTYIERSRRNQHFTLPSGRIFSIPLNLYIIATMNPLDRGVDEVDAAFERRFAKIAMDPDPKALESRLLTNGIEPALVATVVQWFKKMNAAAATSPAAAVGHAYFWDVTDEAALRELWKFQLSHVVERAFRHDPQELKGFREAWELIFSASASEDNSATTESEPSSA